MTTEFKDISTPNGEPIYQFFHAGVEYFVWFWAESEEACLSKPFASSGGGYTVDNIKCLSASEAKVDAAGGVDKFMKDVFLPEINAYLLELSGGDTLEPPPIDSEHYEQFNFIIENTIYYNNGQLHIS